VESPRTLVHEPARGEQPGRERPSRRIARSPPAARGAETLATDDLVLGRYRLLERLGAGGFGVVWRARDELLHREVAVKQILIGPDGDSERATREALAAARLAHPAIVALFEAAVVQDACYLISELIEGETLAQLIACGEADDRELFEIGLALAAALAHAHARGVIHRDIKPQNVLIPRQRPEHAAAAKLTDFGGASLVGEDGLTRTGDVLGTLAYMAPEQCEGGEVGAEVDLYALALVLYEALSGVNPVRGATPAATARRIGSELDSLRRHRRDLPRALIDAIDDALAPEPEDRGSLEDLMSPLQEALDGPLEDARTLRRRLTRPADLPTRQATLRNRAPAPGRSPVSSPPLMPALALDAEHAGSTREAPARRRRLVLPRAVWLAGVVLLVAWQVAAGRAGVGLLALAALLPVLALGAERHRLGIGWLAAALAPALGLAGLAGAFPALAGQATRWRDRALLGALGYWWLALAEPLFAQRLWLGAAVPSPARSAWEGSINLTASHVISPLLSLGLLLGALLWAAAAVALPWLVRGRSALLDLGAAALWSAGLLLAAPALDAGLAPHVAHPAGRGALLGGILGGLAAVAARALRGPV
jgi:eukaryotic-like serine/threonine-protein kinase